MKQKEMPDRMDMIVENSDFPGYRDVADKQELVNYHQQSNVRIWYNDIPASFDSHWHNAMEIIECVENYYDAESENFSYHLVPGDILIIPSGLMHSLKAPETGTRFVYLINAEPFKQLKDYAVLRPLMTQCLHITPRTEPIIYDSIRHLLEKSRDCYFSKEDFREMTVYTYVMNILTTIGRNRLNKLSKFGGNSVKRYNYVDRFNDILDYINNHYMEDLTLETAADYCGFSKFYFSKLFKEYSNTTFLSYLTYKRLSVAEELLVSSDKSITDIALSSGFASISSFNRCFRQQKGCSPTKYKELYQNNMPRR